MAFIDQVQDLTSLTVSDNDELSQFLKDGVLDVTSRWLTIKPEDVENFTREGAEQTSNGFNPGTSEIVSVIRESGTDGEWYPCTKKSISLQYLVTDVDSLHYASKYNPVYMITQNRNVHVYPAPSVAGNDGFKVLYVNYDPEESDGTDLQHDSTGIKWFPENKVYLVVMYAGIRLLHATLAAKSAPSVPVSQVLPPLSITATDPTAISLTTVNYNSVLASTSTAISLLTVPTYSKPTMAFGGSPVLTSVTFTSIDSALDASPSLFSTATVSASSVYTGSVPTYTKPTMVLEATPTISDLSITAVPPDTPALTEITFSSIDSDEDATLPTYTTATVSAGEVFGANTVPTYTKPTVAGDGDELTDVSILGSDNTIDTHADQIEFDQWWSTAAHLIEGEEDVELAAAQLQKISTYISAYQTEVQNELNEFNKENASFQANIQEAMQEMQVENQVNLAEAQGGLQLAISNEDRSQQRQIQNSINNMKAIFDNNAELIQKYQVEIAAYQAEVGTQVQEYQQNLAGDIQVWQAERQTDLQKYNTDVQNEVNEFNKENVAYQSAIQESMQEVQISNQVNLAKAQSDLQVAIANKDRDQQRQLQNGINDMNAIVADNTRKIALWKAERETDLQRYNIDVQNELNEFNKENASFGYEMQKALSDAQAANQVSLQNGSLEARDAIENNNAQIARFQSMAQHYATQVNEDVQKYTVQVQALSADIQASVAEHGAELQGTQAEYQWLQDQYTRLKAEYDQAFMIAAPKQQSAPEAA